MLLSEVSNTCLPLPVPSWRDYPMRHVHVPFRSPLPLVQCRFHAVKFCTSTSAAGAASTAVQLQTWHRKLTPTLAITPYFYPSMSCIVHTQHRNKRAGLCGGGKGLPPLHFSAELLPPRATETTRYYTILTRPCCSGRTSV
jgi:hypothetical protein